MVALPSPISLRSLLTLGVLALLAAVCWTPLAGHAAPLNPNDEYVLVSGGPSLSYWEQFRREEHRHDRWWGNFVRSARMRIQELQKASNNQVNITWLVYRPGYLTRATEDGEPLIANIESVRDRYKVNLVWFESTDQLINYLNNGQNRRTTKVSGFEYFGHSNKHCFVFDYSNDILGASTVFLHEADLSRIDRRIFAKGAYAKSWGCHSGESFSQTFRRLTGVRMIGAVGKTDYSKLYEGRMPFLSTPGGRWTS
jgi:hypothetical protein